MHFFTLYIGLGHHLVHEIGSRKHEIHHENVKYNYGLDTFDYIFGTYKIK